MTGLIVLTALCNLTSFACVVGAVFLAFHGKDGWGWFLAIALFAHCVPSTEAIITHLK
jgi:hypothetical protein